MMPLTQPLRRRLVSRWRYLDDDMGAVRSSQAMVPAAVDDAVGGMAEKVTRLRRVLLLPAIPLLVAEVVAANVVGFLDASGLAVLLLNRTQLVAPLALDFAGIALRGQQVAQAFAVPLAFAVGIGLGVTLVNTKFAIPAGLRAAYGGLVDGVVDRPPGRRPAE